ncbi:hypothetical protein OJAV_G00156060 [Oryzias javanicus]|uniref:Uncharacterized protein n=1 Tax=Oryzias javanicus TaxID=123683 RepID=A0A3S2P211_ORYJA|nr:hypothetical protein OJAV_G00156060 [Oryzias javanicus]
MQSTYMALIRDESFDTTESQKADVVTRGPGAVMSMKDSQLTEPGPPDVLLPDQTSLRRSTRLLPSSPVSPAATVKRKRGLRAGRDGEAVKRPSDASRSKRSPRLSGTSALRRVRRSPSLQEGQAVNGSSSGGVKEKDGAQDSSPVISGDLEDGKTTDEKSTQQEQEAEEESDDSDVSDMYEEESRMMKMLMRKKTSTMI